MNIRAIKTDIIHPLERSIPDILDRYITDLPDPSIVVITSKIVSLCEGRIAPGGGHTKNELAETEADIFIPSSESRYDVTLTIKNNILIPSAGIDESNGNGNFILWPENPQESANAAREFLIQKFPGTFTGVIISDSTTSPLRWGTKGISIAHSGFSAINDKIGTPDLFGRTLKMTKSNIADALAASAVVVMGESNEQTPLALITEIPFVHFQDRNPTKQELDEMQIELRDDMFSPLLTKADWIKKQK